MTAQAAGRTATLHRMVMDKHVCPFGLRALHLLRGEGYEVDDRWLRTRDEVDAFKRQHDVKTTPQIFIDERRVGGHDDLRRYLGKAVRDPKALTYRPVATLFALAAFMGMAMSVAVFETVATVAAAEWTVAVAMCLLALQKLADVDSFGNAFLGYDLLSRRWVPYAWIYPYAEGLAGLLMIAGILMWLSVPIALLIGSIGFASVFKAVYIDRRELKCACVGGNSNVPLGFVSLLENAMMVGMALWMARHLF